MGDNQILFCPTQNYSFHVFQRKLKLDCIFNTLNVNLFQEWRFPLNKTEMLNLLRVYFVEVTDVTQFFLIAVHIYAFVLPYYFRCCCDNMGPVV